MALTTVAGASLSIGPANTSANDLTAYDALSYVAVEQVQQVGDFGDEAQTIREETMSEARLLKAQGVVDGGTLTVTVLYEAGSPGQAAMLAARDASTTYAFKVELNDDLGANATEYFFRAYVTGRRVQMGGPNNAVKHVYSLEVDSAEVERPAAAS